MYKLAVKRRGFSTSSAWDMRKEDWTSLDEAIAHAKPLLKEYGLGAVVYVFEPIAVVKWPQDMDTMIQGVSMAAHMAQEQMAAAAPDPDEDDDDDDDADSDDDNDTEDQDNEPATDATGETVTNDPA